LGNPRFVLFHARGAADISRPGIGRNHQRCRAIHVFDSLADVRHRALGGWFRAALAAGAISRAWRHCIDDRQSVSVRYRQYCGHLPPFIGDGPWGRVARHPPAVAARALSAGRGASGRRLMLIAAAKKTYCESEGRSEGRTVAIGVVVEVALSESAPPARWLRGLRW